MVTILISNYELKEKYHVPCITMHSVDMFGEDEIMDFTYDAFEDALADLFYFIYIDKALHKTAEFKQSRQKSAPKKYREILENMYPNVGFKSLNVDIITGQK